MDVSSIRYVCTPFFLACVVMSSELFTVYVHRRRPLSPVLKSRNLLRNSYVSLSSQAFYLLWRCQSSLLCLYTGCVLWGFAFTCDKINNYELTAKSIQWLGLCSVWPVWLTSENITTHYDAIMTLHYDAIMTLHYDTIMPFVFGGC